MISKGDRIAMNASVETRYPFLDDDVIEFCAGIAPEYKLRGMTEKWLLRQVAARILPPRIANRKKTMFRACMSGSFLGPHRPAWVDQLLSPESLRATGYFDAAAVARQRAWQVRIPRITPARGVYDVALTCGGFRRSLWHSIFSAAAASVTFLLGSRPPAGMQCARVIPNRGVTRLQRMT